MKNIHEILKSYGIEIPEDKKAEFDKAVIENYKTISEVEGLKNKLDKANKDLKTTQETLDTTNEAFEELKTSHASKEDWENKYNELVEKNQKEAKEREEAETLVQERAEFDKYFAEKNKEWNNPFIADGYFGKYKEAKKLSENKGKMTADILHELTKDDATAFKVAQPIVTLKGAAAGHEGNETPGKIPAIF